MYFLASYVPYDPAILQSLWNSIMKTIGSAAGLGFIVFGVIFVIGLFRTVFRYFL